MERLPEDVSHFMPVLSSLKGFFVHPLFNLIPTVPVAVMGASIGKS